MRERLLNNNRVGWNSSQWKETDNVVKIFHAPNFFYEVHSLRWTIFESHSAPANIVARKTLLWVDVRLDMCYGNWQCNIATEAAASPFRTVSHTHSGRHNCPCPSYTVQNLRKTNTTVCEVPGPVRASKMRVNGFAWLCYYDCTFVWVRV